MCAIAKQTSCLLLSVVEMIQQVNTEIVWEGIVAENVGRLRLLQGQSSIE